MNFNADSFEVFDKKWALLTAGDEKHFNSMTISWGGLGTLWNKPVATVYVKPVRYTHEFMEKSGYFTIGFYQEKYRKALTLLGSLSGRDCDKIKKAGLTPAALENAVTFREAQITLICKKIYRQDLDIKAIPEDAAVCFYEREAAHTMYIGEVVDIIR